MTQLPDYEKLRQILERQYRREVLLTEAVETGECLLKVYGCLLNYRGDGAIIDSDTTDQKKAIIALDRGSPYSFF